jgi:crotonobetainyl-CoA:carnitine CoA-transferase CaiB-like acyl-CoA transferase
MNAQHNANDSPALPRPLQGLRIVECGVWHAGPGGCAILGDLGAEVIKVETLNGDPERTNGNVGPLNSGDWGKPNWCMLFEFSNRNKRGISIDTATAEGQEILRCLVERADVFVTNIRTATANKSGLDYATLAKLNPRLIYLNVNGFGPKGPLKDMGGFDPLGQAISGMMYLGGSGEPFYLQAILLDQLTAIAASHAILTALLVRERSGAGQEMNVSLYGSAIWLMHANLLTTSFRQRPVSFLWDHKTNAYSRNSYRCKDDKWVMISNTPEWKYWPGLCAALGNRELAEDPRFKTKELRRSNGEELVRVLDEIFATRTRAEWLPALHAQDLLVVPVQDMMDVLGDPQALANNYLVDYDHPSFGRMRMPGYPVTFGAHTAGPVAPAPELGEHTREVLMELGYSPEQVENLISRQVAKQWQRPQQEPG